MQKSELKPSIDGFKAIVRSTFAVIKAGHKTDIEKKGFHRDWKAWEKVFDKNNRSYMH